MKLAIEHIQRSIREAEAKLEHASKAHDEERRRADARGVEVDALKTLLSDLRLALARLREPVLTVVEPKPEVETKKKRA